MRTDIMRRLRPQSLKDEMAACHVQRLSALKLMWRYYREMSFSDGCSADALLFGTFAVDGGMFGTDPNVNHITRVEGSKMSSALKHVQETLRQCLGHKHFLSLPPVVFAALGYLQTPSNVQVAIGPSPLAVQQGWHLELVPALMIVPRTAMQKSYSAVVGNKIRATQRPHCSWIFQNVVDATLHEAASKQHLRIIDVGGMLGDCCLWASRRVSLTNSKGSHQRSLSCTIFEVNPLYAELAGRTAEANDMRD